MKTTTVSSILLIALMAVGNTVAEKAVAADITFVGSQANLEEGFPGGGLNYVTVGWRTSGTKHVFSTGDSYPNQYYGKDGYALFATTFTYPDANQWAGEANIDPIEGHPLFPNVIDLPEWIGYSRPLSERMAGGWSYALIDDPVLMNNGIRHWSFDGVNYPPATGENNTGQNPWVKMGFLDGLDIFGNNPVDVPAARWGFTVGENAPSGFRIGVMADGGDNGNFAPGEIFLMQFDGSLETEEGQTIPPIGNPLGNYQSTGALIGDFRDRKVDMHFFDIRNAQEGDTFVFGAMAGADSFGNSGIAGFSFDILPDLPGGDADFDQDGIVDGHDFLTWQRGFGSTYDSADLQLWESQFGTAGPPALAVVPEPSSMMLLTLGLAGLCRLRLRTVREITVARF